MEIIVKKTYELSENDKRMITGLFKSIFKKERSWEIHENQFIHNCLGYAWHSIIYDEGKICGISTFIPAYYYIGNEKVLFANCIDSMVDKSHRDFFAYNDMIKTSYKSLQNDNVSFVYCYPNDNAYPITIKAKLTKSIGKMNTFCLPYRIGGIKPNLSIFNPLSILVSNFYNYICLMFASSNPISFLIRKDSESYNTTRYKRNDGKYEIVTDKNLWFSYKIQTHEGIRTAFIIDVAPKSSRNFVKTVRWLIKNKSKKFDLILYPGFLPFKNTGMVKLPRKLEPKSFHFTGKILDKTKIGKEIWDIRNWDTNLSNYDLI